jgi:hypothetical protein
MSVGDFPLITLADTVAAGDDPAWREIADRCMHRGYGDQDLLEDLSGAVRAAALAGTVAEHAKGAYAWHSIDHDLARLSFDSFAEPVRAYRAESGQARVLIFTATPLSLELELMADHVVGQIVPPGPGQVVVETADGTTLQAEADDLGFFDFTGMPRGPVRLRCETPTGRLVTDWVCL